MRDEYDILSIVTMCRGEIFVVEVLLVGSVIGLDVTTHHSLNTTANLSTADVSASTTTVKSRPRLVHCEISVGAIDKRADTRLATATKTNVSGSGCEYPDAVTSLMLTMAAGEVDLLPVCRRFINVARVTVVGRPLTSFRCFHNIRHVTMQQAGIDAIKPFLIHDNFRSRDLVSVGVSDSGVEELASGVFDGSRLSCLEEINLSMNNLTRIVNASFINLTSLTSLNLSHNSIRYIAPHAFVNTYVRYRKYCRFVCLLCK